MKKIFVLMLAASLSAIAVNAQDGTCAKKCTKTESCKPCPEACKAKCTKAKSEESTATNGKAANSSNTQAKTTKKATKA